MEGEIELGDYIGLKDFKGLKIVGGKLAPKVKSVFILHKNAKMELHGNFVTNANCIFPNGRSTIVRLDAKALLKTNGNFTVFYGGDIIVFKGARLELGASFCNSDIKIRCYKHIKIGNGVMIGHDVTIMDTDAHPMNYEGYDMTNAVIIEDNVWLGTKVTVLKGVRIGKGSVIGAGAVVTKNIPPNCLAVGAPARVIKKGIKWGTK